MKKTKTAQKLMDAAEHCLIKGNGQMEMSDVAKQASTSVGLTYHHFGSKSGILAAVVDRFYKPVDDIMMGDVIPIDLDWYQRERARTKAFVEYFYHAPLAPLICGRLSRTPEVSDVEQSHFSSWLDKGASNIAQGQKQGVVSTTLHPHTTISMLIGGLHTSMGQTLQLDSKVPLKDLIDQMWELICNLLQLRKRKTQDNLSHVQ